MKRFFGYLLGIPVYFWYSLGEWAVKGLFPRSFKVWFAGDLQAIEDINLFLQDKERDLDRQLLLLKEEIDSASALSYAGNSSAALEGAASYLDATDPKWDMFESRLKEKDTKIESMQVAFSNLSKAVLDLLNSDIGIAPTTAAVSLKKMSDAIAQQKSSEFSFVFDAALNYDLGTTDRSEVVPLAKKLSPKKVSKKKVTKKGKNGTTKKHQK
jgi:hypothetical protein